MPELPSQAGGFILIRHAGDSTVAQEFFGTPDMTLLSAVPVPFLY